MSAVSVTNRWIPDSPRRKPRATPTTFVAAPAYPQPTNQTQAVVTSAKRNVTGNGNDVTENAQNNRAATGGDGTKTDACDGPRSISFAPGTTFHDRTRLKSRGASKQVPPTFHFRPTTSGEKPQTPQMRFKLPKATLPSLHYLSVSQEDFLDPRHAQDIVKTYGIPKYFFRSKSNLLLNSSSASKRNPAAESAHNASGGGGGGAVVHAGLASALGENQELKQPKEAEVDVRPKTSGEVLTPKFLLNRSGGYSLSAAFRSRSGNVNERGVLGEDQESENARALNMLPVYKPLIGEKYTHARFFAPMNPYRSLQLESEVDKYVRHKRRVGLGRYVDFQDTENGSAPNSALVREASMYDLKNEGPAQRPLDQLPPSPDRKPFLRHRARDPKQLMVRPAADEGSKHLMIIPREKGVVPTGSLNLKDQIRP